MDDRLKNKKQLITELELLRKRGRELEDSDMIMPKEGNRPIRYFSIPFQNNEGEWLSAEVGIELLDMGNILY